MAAQFDSLAMQAVVLAKSATKIDDVLRIDTVFRALLHSQPFLLHYPRLAAVLSKPKPIHQTEQKIRTEESLRDLLHASKNQDGNITGKRLFRHLLFDKNLDQRIEKQHQVHLHAARKKYRLLSFRDSSKRKKLLEKLAQFGKFVTNPDLTPLHLGGRQSLLPLLARSLTKYRNNNALLVGPKGIGKSAILREFARQVSSNDERLSTDIHDAEVFQIDPALLRSGVVLRGQFQNQVQQLLDLLIQHPKVILLIQPMDAVIAKDTRRYENIANEEMMRVLITSKIPVLACIRPETKLRLDTRHEWDYLFDAYNVPEPTPEQIPPILIDALPGYLLHYNTLQLSKSALHAIPTYAQQLLPQRCEPQRSLYLLDEICVRAPSHTTITAKQVESILAEPLHPEGARIRIEEDILLQKLSERIIGQESLLQLLASVVSTRMSKWASTDRPRGVFLFGGPTGVGKTETAIQLAELIGGHPNNLIQINCNTLQPTGNQKSSVIWPLLGVPPGYLGHGEDGLLSKIREKPNAVVLFDEFEKADEAIGKMLLQIIDTGFQRDNNGNLLDFRQSFIIFTSNLGCDYEGAAGKVGFSHSLAKGHKIRPTVNEKQLRHELQLMGYGPEFLARIHHLFFFQSLSDRAIATIVEQQIVALRQTIENQNYQLIADADVSQQFAAAYEPREGVRAVIQQLRSDFTRAISLAEQQGDLEGVEKILLKYGREKNKKQANNYLIYLHNLRTKQ